MRILALAAEPPFPPNHGVRLRTWNLLTRLRDHADITLVTWAGPATDPAALAAVRDAFANVVVLPVRDIDLGAPARARRLLRFIAGGLPAYVQAMFEARDLNCPDSELGAVAALHHADPFDVVVAEEEAMACVPLPDLGIPLVVHRLNVFTRVLADVRRGNRRDQIIGLADTRAWRRYDRVASARAALQIATTPESAEDLLAITGPRPTAVITNGVDLPVAATGTATDSAADVAFVGWMGYPPNVDAVVWFVHNVWPLVQRDHPRSTLRIVGREPAPAVLALAGDRVHVTGEVPSIVDACAGVRVGVAPLMAGMGIKNKTLELMAMGIPVVALPHGAEGITATRADGLIRVDSATAMAAEVSQLLADHHQAETLRVAARAFVGEHHSWDTLATRYRAVLEEVVHAARERDGVRA